ncbi:MAG: ATP-binding protein [Chloroflexi bacterium]|nr:ATP-binding protein [Chloroflexota bacterium]
MEKKELEKILQEKEGQTIEFKTSLAEQEKAVQAMVAFANAHGGKVLFGVDNDGKPVGVSVGNNTVEKLANYIKEHTYPSLAVSTVSFDFDSKMILIVESPRDIPPLVGVYLYSDKDVLPNHPADTNGLQAYKRVGKTNQKEDFMRLRQPLSSDPNVILRLYAHRTDGNFFPIRQHFCYSNDGPGYAFRVAFDAVHSAYKFKEVGPKNVSLPPRSKSQESYVCVLNANEDLDKAQPAYLKATYEDKNGFTWQSVLELLPTPEAKEPHRYYFQAGQFSRKIIRFPPKMGYEKTHSN